jgi:hypothetical protein
METQIFPGQQQQLKSYWNRPGGKFGIIAGIGMLVVIGYFLIPILTTVTWNILNFGIALAAVGAFLYVVTHKKLRLSLFYFYESLMKKLVGLVIQMDPFIIAENYIESMEHEREKLYAQSLEVDTQKEKIELNIREKQIEINKLMLRAQTAKEKDMMPELTNATRQIGRLNEYVNQLNPIRENLTKIGDQLTSIHKNSAYIRDLYKSVSSGNAALNSAMKIFKGDPEKKLLLEQSMEALKEDIARKLANMKKALSYSTDFMRSIDLDNATYEKEGLKLLEKFSLETETKVSSSEASKPVAGNR